MMWGISKNETLFKIWAFVVHYHIGAYIHHFQITFDDSKKLTCKQLNVKIQIQNIENMKQHKMCKWKTINIFKFFS
jgi:hypothetical protein